MSDWRLFILQISLPPNPGVESRMLRSIVFSLWLITTNLWAGDGEAPALPRPADVFTIAMEPTRHGVAAGNRNSWYFTTQFLLESLAAFRPIEDPHDARPLDMYQKGVIVLKNGTVLFWLACSADYFILKKQDGTFSFYGKSR